MSFKDCTPTKEEVILLNEVYDTVCMLLRKRKVPIVPAIRDSIKDDISACEREGRDATELINSLKSIENMPAYESELDKETDEAILNEIVVTWRRLKPIYERVGEPFQEWRI